MSRHGDQKGNIRVDAEVMEADKGDIHGGHQDLAVGQVDDAHDPHDQSHPDSDQGVKATDQDPGNNVWRKTNIGRSSASEKRRILSGRTLSARDPPGSNSRWPVNGSFPGFVRDIGTAPWPLPSARRIPACP